MRYKISPNHYSDEFNDHWTIEEKITVFIDRIESWNIAVAEEIIAKDIKGREIALLQLMFSFFEMISKYDSGDIGKFGSKDHFKRGVRLVFRDISPESDKFLNTLYKGIRNGMYHVCRPAPNIIISREIEKSIGYNEEIDFVIINPDQLVKDIKVMFESYKRALLDEVNQDLRSKFLKRFDFDNQLPK